MDGFFTKIKISQWSREMVARLWGFFQHKVPDVRLQTQAHHPYYKPSNVNHNQATTSGKGITIAMIDTGIHLHNDVQERIVVFRDFLHGKHVPYDDNGHGTHCAGCAAGNGCLSQGLYKGPAYEANLAILKVLDEKGAGQAATVVAAIEWCIRYKDVYNIRVLSLSFGYVTGGTEVDDPVIQSVEKAWRAGIVVCVSAGNKGPEMGTISSPGMCPTVITVGASDTAATHYGEVIVPASYSSRGPTVHGHTKPDFLLPGTGIISLRAPYSYLDQRRPIDRVGEAYCVMSGTSMATSRCAGLVALLLEKQPELTPDEIKEKLVQAANDLGYEATIQGRGYLNFTNL
ncbi:intracellular alkaline serine proteinase [Fictibacillus macauensis ZFHKF-1]|uniref:Intracellular alkaline serine proteinase n=1 Tax=Fictibacillus macauensis ZFHKF-1 TaxID=1196324 RepID=I8UAG0_9BACL|nr:S8 family peptidase [Fictibacillus macauensis]EIT83930.1 intracellular alkaline serine proteinase [Fictibacillus macauensis ZFHKF-1]